MYKFMAIIGTIAANALWLLIARHMKKKDKDIDWVDHYIVSTTVIYTFLGYIVLAYYLNTNDENSITIGHLYMGIIADLIYLYYWLKIRRERNKKEGKVMNTVGKKTMGLVLAVIVGVLLVFAIIKVNASENKSEEIHNAELANTSLITVEVDENADVDDDTPVVYYGGIPIYKNDVQSDGFLTPEAQERINKEIEAANSLN